MYCRNTWVEIIIIQSILWVNFASRSSSWHPLPKVNVSFKITLARCVSKVNVSFKITLARCLPRCLPRPCVFYKFQKFRASRDAFPNLVFPLNFKKFRASRDAFPNLVFPLFSKPAGGGRHLTVKWKSIAHALIGWASGQFYRYWLMRSPPGCPEEVNFPTRDYFCWFRVVLLIWVLF